MKQILSFFVMGLLVFASVACVLSCSDAYRTIEVSLEGQHPWESTCHRPMWYTLVWTDGKGGFQRLHLDAGTRSVSIPVPRGMDVVFCAYPLGELEPFGGVFHPLYAESRMTLTQREGCIAKLLQTLSKTAAGPINCLNYPMLLSLLDDILGDDFRTVDVNRLGKDILNGVLSRQSIRRIPPLKAALTNLPSGLWVSADLKTESFWLDSETVAVELSLPEGLHRFLNRELSLELRLLVDGSSGRIFQYVREPPSFLL